MGERNINPLTNIHTSKKYKEVIFINPYSFSGGIDPDAQAYLTASGRTDTAKINTLFVDLKASGLYAKLYAFYPIKGGGSELAHKFNGKDPRDLNDAYRLSFSGTAVVHNASGIVWDGVNTQSANSHFLLSANVNNVSVGYSTPTNSDGPYCEVSYPNRALLYARYNGISYSDLYNDSTGRASVTVSTSVGLTVNDRASATLHKIIKNGSVIATNTQNAGTPTFTSESFIFGSSGLKTNRVMEFGFIGQSFSDSEHTTLNNIIAQFLS